MEEVSSSMKGDGEFRSLVKRAKRRALVKNIVVSFVICLFFHWLFAGGKTKGAERKGGRHEES